MASRMKTNAVTVLSVGGGLPPLAQAVSLALTVLRLARQPTWDALVAALVGEDPATLKAMSALHLAGAQRELLDTHAAAIRLVATTSPRRTIALCSQCGEHIVLTGTAPSSCTMTLRCEGTYVKVAPAKADQRPADQAEESDEHLDRAGSTLETGEETLRYGEDEEPFEFG